MGKSSVVDKQTYDFRKMAIEGGVFYENKLTEPEWVKKYFPPQPLEFSYDRRPKLSFPVTGEIIDRLASIVYSGLNIQFDNAQDEAVWLEIAERNGFNEQARSMVVQPLARGTYLTAIHNVGGVYWENWGGEFTHVIKSSFYESAGYEYLKKEDGVAVPVVNSRQGKRPENQVSVVIDSMFFITTVGEEVLINQHNLPFAPYVLCRAVDGEPGNRYAYPYYLRFRDLLIEYNLVMSQISKAVRIMQNVWVTDKEMDNPNNPLRLDPDTINFVGQGGKLEQAVRQLNLEPELALASRLKQHISSRAQVPDFMTGLSDVGKVESGVALAIVSGPLTELVDRIRPAYRSKVYELISKSMQVEYMARGIYKTEIPFALNLTESTLPADVQKEIDTIIKAKESGLLPEALLGAIQSKVAALLNIQAEE